MLKKSEMSVEKRGKTAFVCGLIGLVLEIFNLGLALISGQIAAYMIAVDILVLILCVYVMVRGWQTMHIEVQPDRREYKYSRYNGSSQGKKKKKNPYKKKK